MAGGSRYFLNLATVFCLFNPYQGGLVLAHGMPSLGSMRQASSDSVPAGPLHLHVPKGMVWLMKKPQSGTLKPNKTHHFTLSGHTL